MHLPNDDFLTATEKQNTVKQVTKNPSLLAVDLARQKYYLFLDFTMDFLFVFQSENNLVYIMVLEVRGDY